MATPPANLQTVKLDVRSLFDIHHRGCLAIGIENRLPTCAPNHDRALVPPRVMRIGSGVNAGMHNDRVPGGAINCELNGAHWLFA
jgi:hypothetical protein